jgi:threonine/homoserine/homoserine lactone efflux protein
MITSFFAGLLMSFIGSISPAGPIALIVLKRGLSLQTPGAMSLVCGAALAEAAYATLAYLGVNLALSRYPVQTSVLRILSCCILTAFAVICIFGGSLPQPKTTGRGYAGANFLLGLSIAGFNPAFLAIWAGAVAIARGAGFVLDIAAAPAFALGVVAGPTLWFWILLKILKRQAKRFRPEILERIEEALPILLLVLAGVILVQAFIPFVRH